MTESNVSLSPTEEPSTKRITQVVKRLIDFFWYLLLGTGVLLVIVTFVVGLNIPADPSERHTDIDFYLSSIIIAVDFLCILRSNWEPQKS